MYYRYTCRVECESGYIKEYKTNSRNVIKLAYIFGKGGADHGEAVTIITRRGEIVSRAIWSVSDRKYIRVAI